MFFNANIILEILRSSFAKEIETFIEQCVMKLDEFELEEFFEMTADFAVLDSIGKIYVDEFSAVNEGIKQKVEGIFDVEVMIYGFQNIVNNDKKYIGKGSGILGIDFSFYAEDGTYSDIEMEYLI